jgi:hypothetical protein
MGYLRFNSNGAACGRGTTVYDDGRRSPLDLPMEDLMNRELSYSHGFVALLAMFSFSSMNALVSAADWPAFRGPKRISESGVTFDGPTRAT